MTTAPEPSLRVALVAVASRAGDVVHNVQRHRAWLRRAAADGAELVAFPECSLTGYGAGRHTAIARDSDALAELARTCAELDLHALVGFAESDGGLVYSSAALLGGDGVLGVMRKISTIPEETAIYAGGSEFPVFDVCGFGVGVAICADASIYEVPKILALRGAQLVLCPHANAHPGLEADPAKWQRWRRRAWQRFAPDYGVHLLACNVARHEDAVAGTRDAGFCGGALAVGPGGDVVAASQCPDNSECMLLVDVPRRSERADALFECLRPSVFYGQRGWVHGRAEPDRRASAEAIDRAPAQPACDDRVDDATRRDQAMSYYCAGARAYHRLSRLGGYPVPPSTLRTRIVPAAIAPDARPGAPIGHGAAALAMALGEALDRRCSTRRFSDVPLPCDQLATLLWAAYGRRFAATRECDTRTVPSGGALFGLGIFVVARNVSRLEPGIHVYRPELARLDRCGPAPDRLARWFGTTDIAYDDAAAAIVLVACLDRVGTKYGERSYRHLLVEAGHVGQNVALAATSLGLACVPAGGFDDTVLSRELQLAGTQLPVHCLIAGVP